MTYQEIGSEEQYWRAVEARDLRQDSCFVYAVRSTRIYCRPSCPSRRPRRQNVEYFKSPDAAEQAGYRPCLRCQPKLPVNPQTERVHQICRYIERHLDARITLPMLAAETGLSPFHLQRVFRLVMGITPRQFADSCRWGVLKAHLKDRVSVTEALYKAGYGSSSRLYEGTSAHLGMTPATYRNGGRGMQIAYMIVDCPLGRLLIGVTERGVCSISLGDQDEALEKALAKEYPAAEIIRDDAGLGDWAAALLRCLRNGDQQSTLPLDIRATTFQRRVWEALRAIPYGTTCSYEEVAAAIGSPGATRAVARACAANRLAVLIPCHRVVRKDGGLGGYRWGTKHKQKLLEQEAAGIL